MKKKFYFSFFTLLSILSIINNHKIKKKNSNHTKKIKIKEETPSILEWARINNIYINENLTLNKNTDSDSSHNFFYFTANTSIENNIVLLKVPYDIMISQNSLNNHFKEKNNKKWENLWNEINNNKNEFIAHYITKQILYISIIIENAINKKQGSIYKKYKPYFDMYDYINMDNFPIFYEDDEINFLSPSGFGDELTKAIESLKEESYIINNDLKITTSIPDSFLKYRVLSMANSINFNNTNLNYDYNETVVVPFIDCFKKVISFRYAKAKYSIEKDKNNKYYLEIKTIRNIKKDEEINLKWLSLSNQDSLLYYGFIEKGNEISPKFYVNVFNDFFRKDLGIDPDKNYDNIAKRDLYELNSEFLQKDVVYSYRNISLLLDKYKNKKEGRYEMMRDNLNYYLSIYDGKFTEGNINLYIRGNEKRRAIKELMKL